MSEKTEKKEGSIKKAAKKPRINPSIKKINIEKELSQNNDSIIEEVTHTQLANDGEKYSKIKNRNNEDFDWSLVLSNDEYSPEQKKDFEDQYKSTLPDVISKQLICLLYTSDAADE